MVCYNPLIAAYQPFAVARKKDTGEKVPLYKVIGPYNSFSKEKQDLFDSDRENFRRYPCNSCIGCKEDRSRVWAARCVLEASLYDENCFITLTFNNDNLQDDSLHKDDFVKFMKRLRKKFGEGIRFFHCGEYGSKKLRPHHHAILFNFDFPDKELFKYDYDRKIALYTSPSLQKLWPFGFSTIGECNFETCAYVARYVTKKTCADSDYEGIEPEYISMSRMPGIANEWFKKYHADVYSIDRLIVSRNINLKPPRYFDKLYDSIASKDFERIKEERVNVSMTRVPLSADRLSVLEKKKLLQAKRLIRSFEDEIF